MLSPIALRLSAIKSGIFILAAAVALSACGGGGSGSGNAARNGGGTPSYTVGGSVFGLSSGGTIVLQDNGVDIKTIQGNGNFKFTKPLANGDNYNVTIQNQPGSEQCAIINWKGSIDSANITNVSVGCYPRLNLATRSLDKSVELSWSDTGATTIYNAYYSSTPCDISQLSTCANLNPLGQIMPTSTTNGIDKYPVNNLNNLTNYYFYIEADIDGGYIISSAAAGARPNTLAFDGAVNAITKSDTGNIYLGGDFTHVSAITGSGFVLDAKNTGNIRGELSPLVSGDIYTVISDGNGGWYIGGKFLFVGGIAQNNISHILSDGTIDTKWGATTNGSVNCLYLAGSTLYLGGSFAQVNGTTRNSLAAINTVDGSLTNWKPGTDAFVNDIVVSGNLVYIGGGFTQVSTNISGQTLTDQRQALAAIQTDGTLSTWNPNPDLVYDTASNSNIPPVVNKLQISNNIIYAIGTFQSFTDSNNITVKRNYIAAINTDANGTLNTWNPAPDQPVFSILADNNSLYVGGNFSKIAGASQKYLAAISPATNNPETPVTLQNWDPKPDSTVSAIAQNNGTVYVTGNFSHISGIARLHAAAISTATSADIYNWQPIITGTVNSLFASGNLIYIGGSSLNLNGVTRNHIIALGPDNSILDWNPDIDGPIKSIKINSGIIYVGGKFHSIGGTTVNNLAAIDVNGALQDWYPDPDNEVDDIALYGSYIFFGGTFSHVSGGLASNGISAISNANFSNPIPFPTAASSGASIHTLYIVGSTLYIGGDFSATGTTSAGATITQAGLAAYDISSTANNSINITVNTSWTPQLSGSVNALLSNGNTLYAGGKFVAGSNQDLAAFSQSDGSLQQLVPNITIDPNISLQNSDVVNTLTINGNTIYFGGKYLSFYSLPGFGYPETLGAFDVTTGAIINWPPNTDGEVKVLSTDGSFVYAGGSFSTGALENVTSTSFSITTTPNEFGNYATLQP